MEKKENNLNNNDVKLKRLAGFWTLVLFGLVFMQPTTALTYIGYTQVATAGHSVLAFAVGTVIVFFTCLSYSKMVTIYPNAGSAYAYASRGIGPKIGFVVGWVMLMDYVLNPMLVFAIGGLYLNRFVPSIPVVAWAIILAVIIWSVNIIGLQVARFLNGFATLFQIVLCISFVALTVMYLSKNGYIEPSYVIYRPDEFSITNVMSASAIVILCFLGFDGISTIAEEATVEPKKIGTAIKTSVLIQAAFSIIIVFFASLLIPKYAEITNIDTICYDLYGLIGGEAYTAIMLLIGIALSVMAMNSTVMAGSRLLYSMGRDGVISNKVFGYLSPKFRTPTKNITIIILISLVGALTIEWTHIAEIVAFGAMIGFAFVNLSVIKQFWITNKEKKIFSNLIFPILGFISVVFAMIMANTICKIVGGIWLALGVIYLLIRCKSPEFRNNIEKEYDI